MALVSIVISITIVCAVLLITLLNVNSGVCEPVIIHACWEQHSLSHLSPSRLDRRSTRCERVYVYTYSTHSTTSCNGSHTLSASASDDWLSGSFGPALRNLEIEKICFTPAMDVFQQTASRVLQTQDRLNQAQQTRDVKDDPGPTFLRLLQCCK